MFCTVMWPDISDFNISRFGRPIPDWSMENMTPGMIRCEMMLVYEK